MGRQWSTELIREVTLTVYNAAGHLIATEHYGLPLYDSSVEIIPSGRGAVCVRGNTRLGPEGGTDIEDNGIGGYVVGAFAGAEAEAIRMCRLDDCPIDTARAVTYQHDLDKVHELLSRPGVRVDFAVDEAINTAAHLVSARWAAVDTVARVLQEQGRLSAIELYRLVGTPRARRRHG